MSFTQPIAKVRSGSDEESPWFWNPGRIGITLAPEWFRAKLHELDPELECAWDREHELWQIWVKKPSLHTRLCQGWFLLFPVHDGSGGYVPLDERTLAKIHAISARQWGDGKKYFDAVMRERERDQERVDRKVADEDTHMAYDYFAHTLPRVGYGSISASKVVGK